jgi:hypothetical protein
MRITNFIFSETIILLYKYCLYVETLAVNTTKETLEGNDNNVKV